MIQWHWFNKWQIVIDWKETEAQFGAKPVSIAKVQNIGAMYEPLRPDMSHGASLIVRYY